MQIKELNKATVRQIESKMAAALKAVAEEFGVQISPAGGSFSGNNATLKIQVSIIDPSGQAVSREVEDFNRYCASYGLKPENLNQTVTLQGRKFKIVGLNTKAVKFPVIGECNGKRFKLSSEQIVAALGGNPAIPKFLQQQLDMDRLFGKSGKTPESESEILEAIDGCDASLSPENLTCDGELSAKQVATKRSEILQARKWLESKLGRSVEARF